MSSKQRTQIRQDFRSLSHDDKLAALADMTFDMPLLGFTDDDLAETVNQERLLSKHKRGQPAERVSCEAVGPVEIPDVENNPSSETGT